MNFLTQLFASRSALPPMGRSRRGIELKSALEVERMRESGRIVATVLKEIAALARPGMSTADLDAYAEERIRAEGATPSFKGYHGFPASICACLNHEVVHGIPHKKVILREGDLLKVDTGAFKDGYHGDSCITIAIGRIKPDAAQLMKVAEAALYQGIEQMKPGNSLFDIAAAIEDFVTPHGYSVVDDFTGHGVGRNLHEPPAVFHTRTPDLPKVTLKAGMTLAIEPIINAGSKVTRTLRDRWMVVTADRRLSAQFEHTVLVTATGYEILTDRNLV
ncbi:type I methionyl aminopeptidase [Spirulina sp. CCNP1310]|uniref:type I methionyl aminopeptidase n=1 Tax=Spirulina sp. CCNP1310 TaxID=3110249 RepID=UPI002B209DA7|nr:type I methionyl aminopeptidase [Spirulina sp. CCNP1310]MEA5421137.1 type I methionyl aminopeptidase [Spirulina sp. CCNP1310]